MAKASSLKTAASCLSHTERWDEEGNNNDSSCFCSPSFIFSPYILDITASFPPLPSREEKKNGQQISILLSGNINRAHATSTLHSSHCSSPDASCFFGSFCTDPTRLTHGLEAERRRILAVAPPHPPSAAPPPTDKKQRLVPDD